MSLGSPLLVQDDQRGGLAGTSLSHVSMNSACIEKYQECFLQEIIDQWPNIIPVRDFYPSIRSLCSLGREVPVPLSDDREGSIDNLLLADDGHLVIIETKLWRNPEAVRKVVAQTLQYGMAVSQLTLEEFERRLRRSNPHGHPLQSDETVSQRARELPGADDEFEDRFDIFRRRGEILLLIVADGIHQSAERLVGWINDVVGTSPVKFGLVEFGLYDLPDVGRVIIPRTLLRIREASRHVIAIDLRSTVKEQVQVTVSGDQELPKTPEMDPPANPLTEGELLERIHSRNHEDIAKLADTLFSEFRKSGLTERGLPASIQYGVAVAGDFIPLATMDSDRVWFQIPLRAKRDLERNDSSPASNGLTAWPYFIGQRMCRIPTKPTP